MTRIDDDDAEVYELEEELPELKAPFAQAFGPELSDSRLSTGARVLRLWIRFRCRGNGENNYASIKTLADDLNVSPTTIKRWIQELREIKAIDIIRRGFGKCSYKTLVRPTSVYGVDRVVNSRRLLSGSRDKSDLARLWCQDIGTKNGPTDIGTKNGPTDIGTKNGPSLGPKMGSNSGTKNAPSKVEEVSQLEEVQVQEVLSDASHRHSISEGEISPNSEANPSVDDRISFVDPRIQTAKELTKTTLDSTREKEEKLLAIRKQRYQKAVEEGRVDDGKRQRRQRAFTTDGGASARDVQKLFDELTRDAYAEIPIPTWDAKDLRHAKLLLQDYGPVLVEKVIRGLFDNWDKLREKYVKYDFGPVPTIELVYGWRKTWFPKEAVKDKGAARKQSKEDDKDWIL